MLSKMLIHGLVAALLVFGAAVAYAQAFAPDQGLAALIHVDGEDQ